MCGLVEGPHCMFGLAVVVLYLLGMGLYMLRNLIRGYLDRRAAVAVAAVNPRDLIAVEVLSAAEASFSCTVCFDDAGGPAGKAAVSLPCRHCLCRECAERIGEDAHSKGREPRCPICRQPAVCDDPLAAAAAAAAAREAQGGTTAGAGPSGGRPAASAAAARAGAGAARASATQVLPSPPHQPPTWGLTLP